MVTLGNENTIKSYAKQSCDRLSYLQNVKASHNTLDDLEKQRNKYFLLKKKKKLFEKCPFNLIWCSRRAIIL